MRDSDWVTFMSSGLRHESRTVPRRGRANDAPLRSLLLVVAVVGLTAAPRIGDAQFPEAATESDTGALRRLRELARANSPELAARRAALDAATARARITGYAPPATISAEVEGVPSGFDLTHAQSMRLDVGRDLLPSGIRRAQRAVANAELVRARVELELAERSLDAQLNAHLVRTVAAAAIVRRLAAEDSLLASAEEGLRTRFAVGDARYVDVLRLRTERLRVQTDAAAFVTEARVSHRMLLAAIGEDDTAARVVAAIARTEGRDPLLSTPPRAPALDSLVALSAEVQLANVGIERARATSAVVRAERRPVLAASLGVQRFATDDGISIGPAATLSISLPFTARATGRGAWLAADRSVAAAEAARTAASRMAQATIAAARDRYETARERLALYDAALLRGARDEREAALAAYRSGELSLIELLDFERALSRAEIARLRTTVEAAEAFADLFGGHGDSDDDLPLSLEDER